MSRALALSPSLVLLVLTACNGGDDGGRGTFGSSDEAGVTLSGNTTVQETSDSNSTAPGDGDGDSGDGDGDTADTGLKLDTLNQEEGPTTADDGMNTGQGCKAIDFLFIIDNSGSMGDNQQNLINSFPGFISKIQEVIADVDSYHIMVVKTDQYWNDCTVECVFFPGMCQFGGVNACDGPPSVCDETLGGGVNFPVGENASNHYCDLTGGQRFITPEEPLAALPQRFTCIASVGTDGDSSERPMAAMTAAVGPMLEGPGGCNSGFLRDDAVLVITIITDEDDQSAGTPAGWYQNIIAQKGGDGEGVAVLGLINDVGGGNPICPPESPDPVLIREFVEMFPYHIEGSVCALDYSEFFDQAVDLINTTCDEYTPIG